MIFFFLTSSHFMYLFIITLLTTLCYSLHFLFLFKELYGVYQWLIIIDSISFVLFFISFHKSHSISNKCLVIEDSKKYCKRCDMYIERYDHHCHFLDNCIGENNYKYYFQMCTYAISSNILYVITSIVFIKNDPTHKLTFRNLVPISFALTVLTLLVPLWIKHIYLIKKKQTTFESVFYPNVCKSTLNENDKLWRRYIPL